MNEPVIKGILIMPRSTPRTTGLRLKATLGALALLVGSSGLAAAGGFDETAQFRTGRMTNHHDILVMVWKGAVQKGISEKIRDAFEQNKDEITAVELRLDSTGGSVSEGERVIEVLQDIKRTHKLYTSVAAGKRCASMCVFIYAQGQRRLAAPASLWLFHEVSHFNADRTRIVSLNRASWLHLIDRYLVPAGVSPEWIEQLEARAVKTDVWESGSDLLRDGSNLVQRPLSDARRRAVGPVAAR
jgi:hypothetical protein